VLLDVRGIHVSYRGREVLCNVSLRVEAGEIVALIGANASGKTTTLRSIIGLSRVTSGKIELEGQSILGLPPDSIVRCGVAIVPENRRLFPRMTIAENLLLVLRSEQRSMPVVDSLARVVELFPILRDPHRLKQLAGTLSGGEQQQVAMARALLLRPRLLLLDEPSMGMSMKLVEENFLMVRDIARAGVGVLMVEQNVKMALSLAQRGYVLQEGRIILQGPSQTLLTNPVIRHAYLGEFI